MDTRGGRAGSVEIDVELFSGRETGGVPSDGQGLERVDRGAHFWREIEAIGAVSGTSGQVRSVYVGCAHCWEGKGG